MAKYTGARLTLTGTGDLEKLLEELPRRVIKKGLRQAMSAAGQPILKQARRDAPRKSGLLKKSLQKKVKAYKSGNVAVIIGAAWGYTGWVVNIKLRKRAKPTKLHRDNQNPGNYSHLVEQGHGGPRPAPAHAFLKPAYEANKARALSIATRKLTDVLESEAAKLAKKT